jgi:RimJ/RimL family protein N-acetyltransferase
VGRVALCTDVRNARSRTAIERIGARFEGILRQHRPSAVEGEDGRLRDSALYALTADDWPGVRDALRARLSPNWNERHAGPADR